MKKQVELEWVAMTFMLSPSWRYRLGLLDHGESTMFVGVACGALFVERMVCQNNSNECSRGRCALSMSDCLVLQGLRGVCVVRHSDSSGGCQATPPNLAVCMLCI